MKTIYSCLFALFVLLPTLSAQTLTSTHQANRIPFEAGFNNPFPSIPDTGNELKPEGFVGFEEFNHKTNNQVPLNKRTSKKHDSNPIGYNNLCVG
jgi:hypothetical protein